MAKKIIIFLAIAVVRFYPMVFLAKLRFLGQEYLFSWLNSTTFVEVCEYHEKPQFLTYKTSPIWADQKDYIR